MQKIVGGVKYPGVDWYFKLAHLLDEREWVPFDVGGCCRSLTLVSDSPDVIKFSWDGVNLAGMVNPGEVIPIDDICPERVYLRGSGYMRIWAY